MNSNQFILNYYDDKQTPSRITSITRIFHVSSLHGNMYTKDRGTKSAQNLHAINTQVTIHNMSRSHHPSLSNLLGKRRLGVMPSPFRSSPADAAAAASALALEVRRTMSVPYFTDLVERTEL